MRKRVISILLIFSLLYSIMLYGKEEEQITLEAEMGFGDIDLEALSKILSKKYAKAATAYRLKGLWQEVTIPKNVGMEEIYYHDYVDCKGTHLLHRLRQNITYGIAEDAKRHGRKLDEGELGVLKLQRVVFWDGIYHVFLKSDKENEIYMLLQERGEKLPMYCIVAVDLWADGSAETSIWDGDYGYNSILEWDSYIRLDEGTVNRCKLEVIGDDNLYGSHYRESVYYALYDYHEKNGLDMDVTYIMDSNLLYSNQLDVVLDVFLCNGEEKTALLVDTWNKKYTVLQ